MQIKDSLVHRAFPRLRKVETEAQRIPLRIEHVAKLRGLPEQRAVLLSHLPDLASIQT